MIYELIFSAKADQDIANLKKSEIAAYNKVVKFLLELMENPYTGTGKPELLKHDLAGCYSRRITHKHRLIYSIDDQTITVLIISAAGHYYDK